jgi:hypothetical protein
MDRGGRAEREVHEWHSALSGKLTEVYGGCIRSQRLLVIATSIPPGTSLAQKLGRTVCLGMCEGLDGGNTSDGGNAAR